MPLEQGNNKATISKNISEMVANGHPQNQAVAKKDKYEEAGGKSVEEFSKTHSAEETKNFSDIKNGKHFRVKYPEEQKQHVEPKTRLSDLNLKGKKSFDAQPALALDPSSAVPMYKGRNLDDNPVGDCYQSAPAHDASTPVWTGRTLD